MARFPSIDETGAFEAPEVQNKIKELVTGGAGDIRVDTSVGTRVFVGDTMIHGDTGLRDVSSLLQPGWNATGSTRHAVLQRINNKVYFQAWVNITSDESSYPFALPNGFGSAWYTALGSGRQGTTPLAVAANGSPRITNIYPPVNAGQNVMLNLMFHTFDAWPTSLPGVPS